MADEGEWKTLQKGFNRLYDEMEDLVYDFIADQECDTEEKWQALMDGVSTFNTWEFEKELYESCIQRKWDQWYDEQEGYDNLGDNTQEDDFKLEVPDKKD